MQDFKGLERRHNSPYRRVNSGETHNGLPTEREVRNAIVLLTEASEKLSLIRKILSETRGYETAAEEFMGEAIVQVQKMYQLVAKKGWQK